MLRAIVFDLDDTLYPERSYVLSGFRAVATWAGRRLGIPVDQAFVQLQQLFEEGVRGNTFDLLLQSHGLEANGRTQEMLAVYREHEPEIAPDPEAMGLLQRLRERYQLGLITDGYLAVQQKKLAALGLTPFFDSVVFSDELGREAWKPSRLPFDRTLKRLGTRGTEAVYVADNPSKDFLGARLVGMRTVRVRQTTGLYRQLEPPSAEHAPDYEIVDLTQLEPMLAQIGG